jgi:hypothetical protein
LTGKVKCKKAKSKKRFKFKVDGSKVAGLMMPEKHLSFFKKKKHC